MSDKRPSDAELADMNPATDVWAGSLVRAAVRVLLSARPSDIETIYRGSLEMVRDEAMEELFLIGVQHWDEYISTWRKADPAPELLIHLYRCFEKVVIVLEADARQNPARARGRSRERYQ